MKKYLILSLAALVLIVSTASAAPTTTIVQNLRISDLANNGIKCLQVTNLGLVTTSTDPCGSGGSATTTVQAGGNGTATGPALTISTTSETNLGIKVSGSGVDINFLPVWIGTLADGRITSATNWNNKISGFGTSTQVAYYDTSSTLTSSNALTFNGSDLTIIGDVNSNGINVDSAGTSNLGQFVFVNGVGGFKAQLNADSITGSDKVFTFQDKTGMLAHLDDITASTTFLWRVNNLADLDNTSTARINLGLGDLATANIVPYASTTGTQPSASSTINTLIGPWTLLPGTNVTLSSSSNPNTITINSTASGGGSGLTSTTPFSVGYVPYATSVNSLTDSAIFQFNSNIGIGTTTPTSTLHVIGSGRFSGQVIAGAGSAAAPSLTFTDNDTGFLYFSNNGMKFSGGGSIGAIFSANGIVGGDFVAGNGKLAALNAVATPAHTFQSDENTGMYQVVADTLGFSTAGVNRLTINSNGLATANTSSTFLYSTTATTTTLCLTGDTCRTTWANGTVGTTTPVTTGYFPYWGSGSGLTGTSSIFQSAGNVGIGTTTPGSLLSVAGDVSFGTSTGLLWSNSSTTLQIGTSTDPSINAFVVGATQRARFYIGDNLDANMLMGIQNISTGTSAAAVFRTKSDVATINFQSHANARTIPRFGVAVGGWNELLGVSGNGFLFGIIGANPIILGNSSINRIEISSTTETVFNNPANDWDFRVEGDNEPNLLFADASTDRVGIGTSTPAVGLHVVTGTATSTLAAGSTAIGVNRGQLCLWNGASYTRMSFAANSITPVYSTSTVCQ